MATNADVITDDLPCKGCQYNLRGSAVDQVCPECRLAIGSSLIERPLDEADPRWVRRLAVGGELVWWSVVAMLAAGLLSVLTAEIGPLLSISLALAERISDGIGVLAFIVMLEGLWLLFSPEHKAKLDPRQSKLRRSARVGLLLIVMLVAALSTVAVQQQLIDVGKYAPWRDGAMIFFGITGAFGGCLLICAGGLYLWRLHGRIPPRDTMRLRPWVFGFGLLVFTSATVANGLQAYNTGMGILLFFPLLVASLNGIIAGLLIGSFFALLNHARRGLWMAWERAQRRT